MSIMKLYSVWVHLIDDESPHGVELNVTAQNFGGAERIGREMFCELENTKPEEIEVREIVMRGQVGTP